MVMHLTGSASVTGIGDVGIATTVNWGTANDTIQINTTSFTGSVTNKFATGTFTGDMDLSINKLGTGVGILTLSGACYSGISELKMGMCSSLEAIKLGQPPIFNFTSQSNNCKLTIASSQSNILKLAGEGVDANFNATVILKENVRATCEIMQVPLSYTLESKATLQIDSDLRLNKNNKLKIEKGAELNFTGKELIFKAGSIIESESLTLSPSKDIILTNESYRVHLFGEEKVEKNSYQFIMTLKELSKLEKVSEFYKKLNLEKLKSYFPDEADALKAMIHDKDSVKVSSKLIEAGLMNENYIYKNMPQLANLCDELKANEPANNYLQSLPTELTHKIFSYVGLDGIAFNNTDEI